MALDIKAILADGLIALCEEKNLKSITVKDILNKTNVSRQAFYNHFSDKEDLIQWIYLNRILGNFSDVAHADNYSYHDNTLTYYKNIEKYHKFMKQACAITGQNCLSDYMMNYSIQYDQELYRKWNNGKDLAPEVAFAARYHSMATISSCIAWIMSDMPFPAEQMASYMVMLRDISLGQTVTGDDRGKHQ